MILKVEQKISRSPIYHQFKLMFQVYIWDSRTLLKNLGEKGKERKGGRGFEIEEYTRHRESFSIDFHK